MDVPFERLGKDKVVISLEDFETMLDLIAYDRAKAKNEELFDSSLTLSLIEGGNPLKAYRKQRELSQIALSKDSGITQALISDIENGKKKGSITTLKALADALSVEISDLI